MSDENDRIERELSAWRASWKTTDRGPHIIIALCGDEFHVSRDVAANLRDGLNSALAATDPPHPTRKARR